MEIWLAINSVTCGMIIGAVLLDWHNRARAMEQIQMVRVELSDSVGKLNTLHNEISTKIIELQEKVAAHEYQLTAKIAPKRPNPFGGKT